jgi:CRP-like cAMP-binding protein
MDPFLRTSSRELIDHFHGQPIEVYGKDEFIGDQSSSPGRILIIKSGTVRTSMLSAKGSERLLFYATPGCIIGDAMFFGEPVNDGLRAVASTRCEIIKVHNAAFADAIRNNPQLLLSMLTASCKKLTIAIEQLGYATFEDTTSQLVDLLEALSNGKDDRADTNVIRMTHQDLADATGRTRVSITNALSRLQKAGVVRLNRGYIELMGSSSALSV